MATNPPAQNQPKPRYRATRRVELDNKVYLEGKALPADTDADIADTLLAAGAIERLGKEAAAE